MSKQNKNLNIFVSIVSIIVFIFLGWLIYLKEESTHVFTWVDNLPFLNAGLNFLTATLLIIGYRFIKNGKKKEHIITMLCATASSALFLVSYILYHHFHGDTKFIAQGFVRPTYFFILISHILLSMAQVPLIFLTLIHAFKKNYESHKKFAKITFPIWLYVSVTGVLIFIFLKFLNH